MLIKTDPSILAGYLEDASGFLGGHADKLLIPETEAEVAEYLAAATLRREPVTFSGGGTGVTAGRIPKGGTLMSLERLDSIGPVTRTATGASVTVGPAVRLETVKALAQREGFIYAPDPTERTGTLGGNASTNASGGQSFKYGPTREHILGLTLALASGETLRLERGACLAQGDQLSLPLSSGRQLSFQRPVLPALAVNKNAAGYFSTPNMDALDLFIGMEGTLGAITSLQLKFLPAPAGVFSLVAFFRHQENAIACAAVIRAAARGIAPRAGLTPAALEFMDAHALNLLRPQFPQIPTDASACLMIEQEFTGGGEEASLAAWSDFLQQTGVPENYSWFAEDTASRERLREFRHALPEAVNAIVRARKLPKVGTDMAVPVAAFPGMLKFYTSGLTASGLEYLLFGHIGDCHLHVNVLPRDAAEYQRARQLYLGFAREAVRLGGTISAEHGVGKLKHDFFSLMAGPEGLQEMLRVKRILDPAGILNRGNIFPEAALEE